ncbi:hypothetical protein ILUMI_13585 [Ignelater luminosus]|uniref:Carboxylic ester hydrolase n=1 Tax=Ignelater luminosus TaxID=2038154 RepID=A0A8K0CY90_IGNLU|nr:hypothetical protein ILUMI_13585 [Ignelater luminosus]
MIFQNLIGSEDCLFLNVYTPELPSGGASLKPVMVWIHGGGFTTGSGNSDAYGPGFIISEDVVVVTINYRLGFLGFLSMEDASLGVSGNAGLKDQVMALRWIQKNISHFGGDPNNVTIFGESAGGASVHYLMLSPMAKGLFHRAIAQSGSALGCWARGQKSAPLIATALGLDTTSEKEILKVLQEMPVEKIFEMQEKVPDPFIPSEIRPFGPVVEASTKEPTFLSEEPIDLISSGRFNQVPLMIGYTSREGMLSEIITKNRYGEVRLITDFERAVPYMLNMPKGSEMSKKVAERIKRYFYGDSEPSLDNIDQYYLLQTDNFFLRSIQCTVKHHAATSPAPVYLYRMSIQSTLNFFKILSHVKAPGVCHADDIGYLFHNALTPPVRPGSIEDEALRRFVKLWTNFARNGDPNPIKKDSLINVTWKPAEKDQLHFLDIGENLTVGANPEAGRMAFWDEIYSLSPTSSKL